MQPPPIVTRRPIGEHQFPSYVYKGPGWLVYRLVPPPAAPASAGHLGDLSGAKVKRYEGSVVKSLSIEIVRVVFALLFDNARAFLQECQHVRGLLVVGRLHVWATPRVGRIGPKLVYLFRGK